MSWNDENLIFLVSLPRSGSTLLQRILSSQHDIESTSESWLLLPQVYALKEGAGFSEYSQTTAARAINDFIECLPGGHDSYLANIADGFVKNAQQVSGDGRRYYLEKTPRNNLILPEVVAMFPQAKYIFLWRNPAAIAASMIESFAGGNWNLYHHDVDFDIGLKNMLGADKLNIKNRIDIRYEDLVLGPLAVIERLFLFLDLAFNPAVVEDFSNKKLAGRMGDPTGVNQYSKVSTEPLEKWVKTFANPLRRHWLKGLLATVDETELKAIGYDRLELLTELSLEPLSFANVPGDAVRMLYGYLDRYFHLSLIRRQFVARKEVSRYRLQ